jgi:hypothetical protein
MLHHLLHAAESQTADGLPHAAGAADKADYPLNFQRSWFLSGRHNFSEAQLGTRFFRSLAAAFRNLCRVFQVQQCVEGGLDDIVGVRRAE